MTINDIKQIPKYIEKLIEKKDKEDYKKPDGTTRFYAYISRYKREIIKITVAVKQYKGKRYYKQVAVHGLNAINCFVKDMGFYFIGGYKVGWYAEGIQKYEKWYEDGKWDVAEDKYFDPYAFIVNREYILKFPEYKYSAVTEYRYVDVFKYLRLYKQYPQAELLVKFGLSNLATYKTILSLLAKNKAFRRWIIQNRYELATHDYYTETIIAAFKQNKPLDEAQTYLSWKKKICQDKYYNPIRELFKGKLLEQFFSYIKKQSASENSYLDYLKACNYLKLDMTEDKNRFPHDFYRWHDIRIDEYMTAKAIADEKERQKLYKSFAKVSEKYLPMQRNLNDAYICIIAKSPAELIKEGNTLHHCVGRMGYDQKMVREESLIFFIRTVAEPDKPFVTIEYSLSQKKVLQCYGDRNHRPDETVMDFVNKKWLPFANKQLNKIKKANIIAA